VCPQLADDPSTAPSENERRTHSAAIPKPPGWLATKWDRPIAIVAQQGRSGGAVNFGRVVS
jgi:hypothetical protein